MANMQLLDIFLIAMVAGVILFRLYTVLGRRTGHERPPQENYRLSAPRPGEDGAIAAGEGPSIARPASSNRPADPLTGGLLDIQLADRSFDKDHFIAGARAAYETIVTAFAKNDRAALRPLLSEEVTAAFEGAMRGREERGDKVTFTFVGFQEVKIITAALKGRMAEITLTFDAQFISATTDAKDALIDGDSKTVRSVIDTWTFSRDVRARDPNWTLVATSGEAV